MMSNVTATNVTFPQSVRNQESESLDITMIAKAGPNATPLAPILDQLSTDRKAPALLEFGCAKVGLNLNFEGSGHP